MKPQDIVVPNWRKIFKRWSFWLGSGALAVLTWFLQAPESAIMAWAALPEDIKAMLPPTFVKHFGMGLLVASILAQFIRQRNLQGDDPPR